MSRLTKHLTLRTLLLASVSIMTLLGCSKQSFDTARKNAEGLQMQDRELGYSRDDFRKAMAPKVDPEQDAANKEGNKIPELASVIADDKKGNLPQPLVSITVNQDVSLRDLFYELAKQAEVDLELDPTITGSIIFTAYNRPFDQVVERIADMASLRYKFKDNVLRVERDTPYMKTYQLDYLSMTRDFSSTINSNTSAASSGSGGSSQSGGSNGSTSTIATQSSANFWNELQNNITQIIFNTNKQVNLTDQSAPLTTPNAVAAVPVNQANTPINQLTPVNAPNNTGTTPAAAPVANNGTPQFSAPVAGLANPTGTQTAATNITGPNGIGGSLGGGIGNTGGGGANASNNTNPYFSVNKQAGLLNVFATEKQHQRIEEYMAQLKRSINKQVLIEAKVFEVELNDENSTGINWSILQGDLSVGTVLNRQPFVSNPVSAATGGTIVIDGTDIGAVIDAISRFGTVRTLSSPRLSVMNNQTAVLNVSESRVFFDLQINRVEASANGPARTDITSQVKSVPEGVIISVHPSIDPDTNEVLMNLRPSITRVVGTVQDPAALIQDVSNPVPELSVRELDSVVRMRSGETVIMGGLMQDQASVQQLSVPVLGEIPYLGNLFRNQRDRQKKTEMVIFLRARVMDTVKPDSTDKDIYKELGASDRRKIPL